MNWNEMKKKKKKNPKEFFLSDCLSLHASIVFVTSFRWFLVRLVLGAMHTYPFTSIPSHVVWMYEIEKGKKKKEFNYTSIDLIALDAKTRAE